VLPNAAVLVFGYFSSWNNNPSAPVVKLKSNGDVDSSFALQGTGLRAYNGSPTVSQVVVMPDLSLLVSGSFNFYNEITVNKFIKLRPDGSMDPSFVIDQNVWVNWIDNAELLTDGNIIISGNLRTNNAYKWFIKLKPDGKMANPSLAVGPDQDPAYYGSVGLFACANGEFIALGQFNGKVNGQKVGVFNKFDASVQPYTDHLLPFSRKGRVVETAVDSSHRIIVVGDFNQYGEEPGNERNFITRLNPDGTNDAGFNSYGANAFVGSAAIQQNGKIVVAGSFSELNGSPAKYIGRLNENGTVDPTFNTGAGPESNASMYDVHISPSQQIYVAGSFRKFDNIAHDGLIKLNTNGSPDHSFSNAGLGSRAPASIVHLPDGYTLYGEGSMHTTMYFDKPMRVYKLDATGKPDPAFNPPVLDYNVTKKLRVGENGAIYWLGTIFRNNNSPTVISQPIIKLNPDGSLDNIAFQNLPSNLFINDFEILPNNKVVIACTRIGLYDSLDVVMRLNPDLTIDNSFLPVSLLYSLQHINFDGNNKINVAGEPKRAFRLENEQMQNIAIITKNGLELQANDKVIRNVLDTTAMAQAKVGNTIDQIITLTNTGTTTIDLLDPATANVYGQNSSEFSIRPISNVSSLKPAESMQFTVRFTPGSVGDKSALIRIPFTDGIQQSYVVAVNASAIASNTVTGVDDLDADRTVRVYPNPLQGSTIYIDSKDALKSYEIINLSGQVVQQGVLQGQNSYAIRLTKSISGSFILKVKTNKKEVLTKMIKL
ncbi:MAG: T9SS type A sorting domain-containing protein, partial [Flavitalea sp.]